MVIHPVAIKYLFQGDFEQAIDETLTRIEHRLSWRPQREMPLVARILKTGSALLALKEMEYLGEPQMGSLAERMNRFTDFLLHPLEQEWLGAPAQGEFFRVCEHCEQKFSPILSKVALPGRTGTTLACSS